jgi:CRP/FNR family transcriptional regulator
LAVSDKSVKACDNSFIFWMTELENSSIVARPSTDLERCDECYADNTSVCAALEEQIVRYFGKSAFHKKFKSGTVIWNVGDPVEYFAVVISGCVKLSKMLADGRQQIVAIFSKSDCFGATIDTTHHSLAEAATDTELYCFPKSDVLDLSRQHPELGEILVKKLSNDLEEARDLMLSLGKRNASERLSHYLYRHMRKSERRLCEKRGAPVKSTVIELPMQRRDLAEYLGLSVETISRTLTQLKSAGVIRAINSRNFQILRPDTLRAMQE